MFETTTKHRLKKLFEKAQRLPKDIYDLEAVVEWTPTNPDSTLYAFTTQLRQGEIIVQAVQLCICLRLYVIKTYGESSPYLRRLNNLFFVPYVVDYKGPKDEELHKNQWINARIELVGLLSEIIQAQENQVFPWYRYLNWTNSQRLAGTLAALLSLRLLSTVPTELFQMFLYR